MRRMKFPGFNVRLTQDQYKKLFENIPLKHRRGKKKKRRYPKKSSSFISNLNKAPGYNADGSLKKAQKIEEGHLKLI